MKAKLDLNLEQVVSRGCGLDVHKEVIVATISGQGIKTATRTFKTTTRSLTELKDWLLSEEITSVAMESTGVYWKPVYNILEHADFELLVVNARHIKYVPGHKTDVKDSAWICKLLLHGLLKRSFIPSLAQRELRDLCRYRRKLIEQISSEKNRMIRIFEDANLKLSSVFSDTTGKTCTRIIDAILSGERSAEVLSSFCTHWRLKHTQTEIRDAVEGKFTPHHTKMLSIIRRNIEHIETSILALEADIDIYFETHNYCELVARLSSIPGVGEDSAKAILAEIGFDMSVFPNSKHLASWAGVCPGNNESAGKTKSGRTTHGNKMVKSILTQCAWAASRTVNTFLAIKYGKLAARRGKKRAIVAIAHKILVSIYYIIKDGVVYEEPNTDVINKNTKEVCLQRYVDYLQKMGYDITLEALKKILSENKKNSGVNIPDAVSV